MYPLTRRLIPSILTVLGVLTMLFGVPAPGAAQTAYVLDHFECYVTQTTPVNEPVDLQDQFDVKLVPTRVGWAVRFCNPVKKIRGRNDITEITHDDDHLMLYRIADNDFAPQRVVSISNQFGKRKINTFDAVFLLVPTQKQGHADPRPTLDHFKCYRASGRSVNKRVALDDQFHDTPESKKVGDPVLFCNPVVKVHETVRTEILHKDHHLTCYRTNRTPISKTTGFDNQFQEATSLVMEASDLLCVPTRKVEWAAVPPVVLAGADAP